MQRTNRRSFAALASALLVCAAGTAAAADYPTMGVKLVVPFAAGGGTDAVARVVAQAMAGKFPQPVIVDNKGGAGGSIGTLAVTQAQPDGHTLLLGSNGTMVLNPLLYPALKYNVERDLVPVAGLASLPYLIAANPQFEGKDLKGLIAAAQAKKITFASPGNGTTNHLVGVLLQNMSKTEMTHVPYRGAAPAMNDVIAGTVNFLSGDFGTLMPMATSGKLRAIAVTGPQRVPILPNVPTVAEAGLPGFEATGWFGIFAPKGTPQPVVERLATEFATALKDPRVTQRLQDLGGTALPLNPQQLKELIAVETVKWKRVITENKVSADDLQ